MSNFAHYRQLFFYGLPGMPLAMLALPLYLYLPPLFAQNPAVSLATLSVALLAAHFLDVVSSPLMGWMNDKVQSRLGRRKLFMLLGAPLLAVGAEFLLLPTGEIDSSYRFAWLSVTYLGLSMVSVPWNAWGAELTRNYHGKSTLAASRAGFIFLGSMLIATLPLLPGIQTDAATLQGKLALLLWILLPLCILPALYWLVERRPILLFAHMRTVGSVLSAHPAIRHLLPAYFINSLANALPATLFILFVTHVLQIPDKAAWMLMAYFLGGILGLPLWLRLARLIDKSRAWVLALALGAVSLAGISLLNAGDVYWFAALCLFSGLAMGADIVLPASIQADIAQQMQHQGNAQTGLLFGLWSLLGKLALALAAGLVFPLLEWTGFAENGSVQASSPTPTLTLLFCGLPAALKLFVAWRMWRFPFNEVDFHDYWEFSHANSMYSVYPSALHRGMRPPEE